MGAPKEREPGLGGAWPAWRADGETSCPLPDPRERPRSEDLAEDLMGRGLGTDPGGVRTGHPSRRKERVSVG